MGECNKSCIALTFILFLILMLEFICLWDLHEIQCLPISSFSMTNLQSLPMCAITWRLQKIEQWAIISFYPPRTKLILLKTYLEDKMNWKCHNGFLALHFWTAANLTLKMHVQYNCIFFNWWASSGPTLPLTMFPLELGRRWVHVEITKRR
jgi:hypothetical protein